MTSQFERLRRGVFAIALLLVAGCGAATTSRPDAHSTPALSSSATERAYEGRWWQLVSVAHAGRTKAVPAESHAFLTFRDDHRIAMTDGVNTTTASYDVTSTGFRIAGDVWSTAAAEPSPPTAAITAVRTLTCGASYKACRDPDATTQFPADGELVVTAAGYEVTYRVTNPRDWAQDGFFPMNWFGAASAPVDDASALWKSPAAASSR